MVRDCLPVLALLLACLGPLSSAAETVIVEQPVVFPDSREGRAGAEAAVRLAVLLAERAYGQLARFQYGGEGGSFRVGITAVQQEGASVLTAVLRPAGEEAGVRAGEPATFAIQGPFTAATAPYLANALFFLWGSAHAYLADRLGPPPELVEEMPTEAIARSALPELPPVLAPTSVAVGGSGSLLLGFSMLCVELDPGLRLLGQPGRSLYEQGNYTYAYAVAATPAGSIFFKPGMGRELFRLAPGSLEPQRWRLPAEALGPFAVLADGSAVIVDAQKRQAFRVLERKVQPLELHSGPYSYVAALAAGPEGTLWAYDLQERRVRVYGPDGRFVDSILPLLDPARGLAPLAMAVRGDGSFLLYCSPGELWAFSRLGVPLWRLAALPGWDGGEESLPQAGSLAADSRRGLVWLTDSLGRRVLKLLDTAYCRRQAIANPAEEELLRLNRDQRRSPANAEPTARKAELYERAGAPEMARELWRRVQELDPRYPRVRERLAALEASILAGAARALRDRALQTLAAVGPESARLAYSRALQLYEQALGQDPANQGWRDEMRELKERFQAREGGAAPAALSITGVDLPGLFPALLEYYRRHPVARVEVQNLSAGELQGVKASVLIKGLMDFPSESAELARLAPGARAELTVAVVLGVKALELEEDLSVQAGVEVTARSGGQPVGAARSAPLTVYRRTALAWDDSGKLASFITPNDGAVTRFAHLPLGAGISGPQVERERPAPRWAPRLERAARICEALGAYGIEYVEDPESPISKVLGREQVVDTVRLPRTTLLIRAGDCDDSTALLASLLESAGIPTAIMTSPGHVYLAFDTQLPQESAWLYSGPGLEAIAAGGSLWIPVESTALAKGFAAAWREGSRLAGSRSAGGEFLPLAGLRERYPPIPLAESAYQLSEPAAGEVDARLRETLAALDAGLYQARLAELGREAAGTDARRRVKALNRLGILHAEFGRDPEAEKAFLDCARADPAGIAPLLNLAALQLAQGRAEEARQAAQRALQRQPDSARANLIAAQAYYQARQSQKAAEHFRVVQGRDPELAARYAYLAAPAGTAARAGVGGGQALPWSEE